MSAGCPVSGSPGLDKFYISREQSCPSGVFTLDGNCGINLSVNLFSLFRGGDLIKGNDFALVPKYLRARLLFRLL